MRCTNCREETNSAVHLWARMGSKFKRPAIDATTHQWIQVDTNEILRVFMFCSDECSREFFTDDSHFDKHTTPFTKRLVSYEEVVAEFQRVLIDSDNEDEKALVYMLGQSVWR